jgi:hypothetical protein
MAKDVWVTLTWSQLVFTLGLYTFSTQKSGDCPLLLVLWYALSPILLVIRPLLVTMPPYDELHHFLLISVEKANLSA